MKDEWVNSREALPDDLEDYLVAYKESPHDFYFVAIAHYDKDIEAWRTHYSHRTFDVSWWRPLPELPPTTSF